ncbi:MAG TPA: hypothetical protein VGT41_00530 [Candidatus Babeliales bacterium]|nr:hypothetical protein [Candidatus Babeliales bacterium]
MKTIKKDLFSRAHTEHTISWITTQARDDDSEYPLHCTSFLHYENLFIKDLV